MTKRGLFSVAMKVIGIICLSYAVETITTIVNAFLINSNVSATQNIAFRLQCTSIMAFVLYCIAGYLLLRFSDGMAIKLIRVDKEANILESHWQKDLFVVGLRIIGIIYFLKGILALIWRILDIKQIDARLMGLTILYYIIMIIISVYLITGAKHIVRLMFKEPKTGETNSAVELKDKLV